MSSTQGGAYRYTVGGEKLLSGGERLGFGYSHLADNLDGGAAESRRNQRLRLDYSGSFAPDFGWSMGYRGALRQDYDASEQQTILFGIERKVGDDSWSSDLWLSEQNEESASSRKYQWKIGYARPSTQSGLKTTAMLQLTYEDEAGDARGRDLELRLTAEKRLFQDMAKSYLVIAYRTDWAIDSAGMVSDTAAWDIQSSLNVKLGPDSSLILNGKVSFWRNEAALSGHGTDYSFSLAWQARFF